MVLPIPKIYFNDINHQLPSVYVYLYLINNVYYLQTWHCDKCKHDIFLAASRMSERVGEVISILYLLQKNGLKTTYSRK